MDSDFELSDDERSIDNNKSTYKTLFYNKYHDGANNTDNFYPCFMHRYSACPVFFSGFLSDACKTAFSSQDIKDRRPVLIYIHHDKSMLNNIFCKTILCTEKMVDYLLENYIVWPWDITLESDRNRLSTIWENTFSSPLFNDFSVEKCPMLIGITRRSTEIKSWLPTSEYQFTSLLKGNTLTRTQQKWDIETLLSELITFKDECDNIEQIWYFNTDLDDDFSHFSDGCESKVDRTEFFYECLQQRFRRCPTLVTDFLSNICESTVSSKIGKEYRPVLIYLHNDKSEFNKTICPITIIDSLLENFIVYPWDNTSELNQEITEITWKQIFSVSFNVSFPDKQYPMVIGIMKRFEEKNNVFRLPKYQFKSLLNGDTLTRTQTKLSREGFLEELILFQQECIVNEQALACDFVTKTGLSWDVIQKISQYLSLNDAINSFSIHILPVLSKSQIGVHISNFSDTFIRMICQKLNPQQIVSLEFTSTYPESMTTLKSLYTFENVKTLTFVNPQCSSEISTFTERFPSWICVRFWYDNEVNADTFEKMFNQLPSSVKRLEIRIARPFHIQCYSIDLNITIKYFLFDLSRFSLSLMNNDSQHPNSHFLMRIIQFIQKMRNIRYVCFITNKNNIGQVLYIDQWMNLARECLQLTTVTMKISGSMSSDQTLTQQLLDLQKALHNIRQTIKFRIIFL
ncbi:unnamed protein product [Adineta steineri]|uniref:UAS domain-containing protein n=1 Tax=Adineta steineri TaxID=433720 RepID=A0A816DRP0_9BILA|nr:unnamed protein product [Adineta steineri]CAF1642391.1 unnamed protein product [Adineta steineri]